MPSDSPDSLSKFWQMATDVRLCHEFFAFSNGYRHTPMPCVFVTAPDVHLCHEFSLHLVNGYRRTPMPCVFTAPDIHLGHVISYLVKAIDIHLCHMFCYGSRHTPVPCFFLFSKGYRHTPMPCVFYGARHTPVPCFFLCLEQAIDIHRCQMFCFLWLQTFTCAMFFLLRTSTRAIKVFYKQNDSIRVLPPAIRFFA
jgi:hypothetical protein